MLVYRQFKERNEEYSPSFYFTILLKEPNTFWQRYDCRRKKSYGAYLSIYDFENRIGRHLTNFYIEVL